MTACGLGRDGRVAARERTVRRRSGSAAIVLLIVGSVATASIASGADAGDELRSRLEANVCALPVPYVERISRGTSLGRSGDIQLLPEEPNFVSAGLSHAGPWDYVQNVPMFWYGPGFVRPGVYDRPVTLADIAPTQAELLRFDFDAPDGRPMREALAPHDERPLPRLVVTLIWDSAGRFVLDRWKHEWPYLRRLLPEGAWFENATSGASPANTPPSHATIGTGAFPDDHGVMDEYIRLGDSLFKPYEMGPRALLLPTLADLYDRAESSDPVVGTVATLDPHVGMMGHGALWGGGDRDIAITRQGEDAQTGGDEGESWNLTPVMSPYYRLPAYANAVSDLDQEADVLDRRDGRIDGNWLGNSIEQLAGGFDTPARTPYQTQLVEAVVQREGFGVDEVPDLLFVNYKAMDTIGHIFSASSPEMGETLRIQDEDLQHLVPFLDRTVGRGRWVMVLTADHGHQFDPADTGAFEIDIDAVRLHIDEQFDDGDARPLVAWMRPTQVWLDPQELGDAGATLDDVAAYAAGLTRAQTAKKDTVVASEEADDRVFAAAFPSAMLQELPCKTEERS
ncbi:MAG: alkaline phosphatase family protein [Actinomycetota bacterium]